MEKRLIISGFGGQGVVFGGKLLAEAAMRGALSTTYFPSYGVAMRGGAAKCDIIISDEEIGSPVIDKADIVIAMSIEAKHKYESLIVPGGHLIYNASLVQEGPLADNVTGIPINANEMADSIGSSKVATLICLGYAGRKTGVLNIESFFEALESKKDKFGEKLLALNKKAVETGWNFK